MSKNADFSLWNIFFTFKYIIHLNHLQRSLTLKESIHYHFLKGREETAQCRETEHLTRVFHCSANRVMEDWCALLHTASRRCCEGACCWLQGEALGILSPFLPLSLVISAEHPFFLREGRRWGGTEYKNPTKGLWWWLISHDYWLPFLRTWLDFKPPMVTYNNHP